MNDYGFVKVAAVTPKLKVADINYNVEQIISCMIEAEEKGAVITVFPELSITGYTCGDLFGQQLLIDKAYAGLKEILSARISNKTPLGNLLGYVDRQISTVAIIGMPLEIEDNLYNCAVAIFEGKVVGVVPKVFLPNYKEFYEKRWFTSGQKIMDEIKEIEMFGEKVPFGYIIIKNKEFNFSIGIEVCEDLWTPLPPSSFLSVNGANIIVNPSASNELVAKADYRRNLVGQQSARCICSYVYTSAGVGESTTDVVFSGHAMVAENGSILKESERFKRQTQIIYSNIDIDRLTADRKTNKSFSDSIDIYRDKKKYQTVEIEFTTPLINKMSSRFFERDIDRHPFIPKNPQTLNDRCSEIFNIQVAGLLKRFEHTGMKNAVIGVSGGLDSTLALLVIAKVFEEMEIPSENILAVTMPGFGTTDETYTNAMKLMTELNVTIKEVDIREACKQHFKDIGHDPEIHDITYENTQARERTQILMDLSNKVNGLVIGTGDLSELALGWCTYNGDHMSMYGVNGSIPKTLVKFLIKWIADTETFKGIKETLYKILDTPISPELLPPDKDGKIAQKTESVVGKYELNDFFLFHTLRYGVAPKKLLFLAEKAFCGDYTNEEIKKWLIQFYKRFFSQQFKRSCLPDGCKVGLSVSPRGDWRMPSDASVDTWLKELE